MTKTTLREYVFDSVNNQSYAKPIAYLVSEPPAISRRTGLMLVCHGYAGNRYYYKDLMTEFSRRYDLVCASPEYRHSGFDHDHKKGWGVTCPYDFSHFQVFDCIGALRDTLRRYPKINRQRIIAFGGSQGGHIALLATAFMPNTFAVTIACSPITLMEKARAESVRSYLTPDGMYIRDAVKLSKYINNPVVLIHGTSDDVVSPRHSKKMASALKARKVPVTARYYEGADHYLNPVTTTAKAVVDVADAQLKTAVNPGPDDFRRKTVVKIPCVDQALIIDWGRKSSDAELIAWKELKSPLAVSRPARP